jgi:hypothetical protein
MPTELLFALLLCDTIIVVLVLLPPIEMGLLSLAQPMPTPLTLDPDNAPAPLLVVLTAVLDALQLYPTTIVVIPPMDTGLMKYV